MSAIGVEGLVISSSLCVLDVKGCQSKIGIKQFELRPDIIVMREISSADTGGVSLFFAFCQNSSGINYGDVQFRVK
ncbi:hypothetical protein BXO88_04445 [Oribacterium sp. C9]|nr:hypothetical protein BXO88_04445 [Oribacterium sp. C9]